MKAIKYILIYLALCGFMYLLFAFAMAEINSVKWTEQTRVASALINFILAVILAGTMIINNDKE